MAERGIEVVDLHGCPPDQAIEEILNSYARVTAEGRHMGRDLVIIHGFFGDGHGSVYRLAVGWLCEFLREAGLTTFHRGEELTGNPGRTNLAPLQAIPALLRRDIDFFWGIWIEAARQRIRGGDHDTKAPMLPPVPRDTKAPTMFSSPRLRISLGVQEDARARARNPPSRPFAQASSLEDDVVNYCAFQASLEEVSEAFAGCATPLEVHECLERMVVWGRLKRLGTPGGPEAYIRVVTPTTPRKR